ncbi:hypothetical protein [Nonomuraea sp. NPDC050691]|uniref:hypothetical protein n=1 Tax=Nonomuraea sp. NPDC050691 TaxID=3155661 RepID=UPI00341064C8
MGITTGSRQTAGEESGKSTGKRRWPSWTVAVCFAVWTLERLAGAEQGSFDTQLTTLTPYAAALTALLTVLFLFRNRPAAVVTAVSCAASSPSCASRPPPDRTS